ncbi:MAG: YaiO family outer membrane beta-barrel protein [Sphingomonadales bacterium]|nr:YaiO family outer membrane beta-barrel protein [Sphingomonadales bacterium]MBD3774149.1 YaiO family outer membrane beta-barrel protein [Paracoccaceae bacterium]
MHRALAGIALALFAAPLAAQKTTSPYAAAVAARETGDPARAARLLEPVVAANPTDTDARVQLGYAYLALGRLDDADAQFAAVLALAPEYADAREGRALVTQRRAVPVAERGWIIVEGAVSDLTNGREDWRELRLSAGIPLAGRDTLGLSATLYDRFGLEDGELTALYTHRASDDLWLRAGASVTPSADFRPEYGVTAGFDYRIAGGDNASVIGVDTAWRKFPLQDVWTIAPSATQYLAGGKASLTLRGEGVVVDGGRMRIGGQLRGDLYPRDGLRLYVGAASGPDTDFGVVTNRKSLFGGVQYPLGHGISLLGSVSRDWRGGAQDRTEGRLGVRIGL